jgi:hypothetical protein
LFFHDWNPGTQQKLSLAGGFMRFGHGVTALFLMTFPSIKTRQPELRLKMETGLWWI